MLGTIKIIWYMYLKIYFSIDIFLSKYWQMLHIIIKKKWCKYPSFTNLVIRINMNLFCVFFFRNYVHNPLEETKFIVSKSKLMELFSACRRCHRHAVDCVQHLVRNNGEDSSWMSVLWFFMAVVQSTIPFIHSSWKPWTICWYSLLWYPCSQSP